MSKKIFEKFREYVQTNQFNSLKIGLASPEKVKSLSYGEVKKIETINYRTLKPERDGLFCARIFGPVNDWECNCGKYKRMKHRGVTCDKCEVEVILSRVRRERMGHINLVSPVAHIWYLKGSPSYLGLIFDKPVKDLERIVYFDAYLVLKQGKSPYHPLTLLNMSEYENYLDMHPEDLDFEVDIGAEALHKALSALDLELELKKLQQDYAKTNSVAARHKAMRRIKVLTGFIQGKMKPEWMILKFLPVLPPDLRPLVPLEGGRFASSDLNELYRRVLNRNIRLQRLLEIEAPSVIIKNEKRMLQESVDSLIDNGRRGQPVRGSNRRPLKSLSEFLRGKQGRFRLNLLGKRVDYSGRSVIVVDPNLRMDQCGIPKVMALELFKSHVFAHLLESGLAVNLRVAKRMVEESTAEVWDVLEQVVKNHPVLLNRAPTLHRLGIQAFMPILVDGKAIKIHPLVCTAFNADFDGDQMALHVPLSKLAIQESFNLMMSSKNLLSPQNGRPITVPSNEIVLGLHYLTKVRCNVKGEGMVFSSIDEVIGAYDFKQAALHAKIKVIIDEKVCETTVGRIILYNALPKGTFLDWVNKVVGKSDLVKLVDKVYHLVGNAETVIFLDKIKSLGYHYATSAGISFVMKDLVVSDKKDVIIKKAEKAVQGIEELYMDGVITNGERSNRIISIWSHATGDVSANMIKDFEEQDKIAYLNENNVMQPFNPISMMLESGARGSKDQIKQLVGMRGLMSKPSGEIIETPVKKNFKDGLTVFDYFVSTHGARKGQADTALRTADAGYLTRRLVDVGQDVTVTTIDCKTAGYITIDFRHDTSDIVQQFTQRLYGRVIADDVKDPITGQLLLRRGDLVTRELIDKIAASAVSRVQVRSVLSCQAGRGVCATCYGMDLSRSKLVDVGIAVGIIAAQSIGEPGTQLTMKTFHVGGIASLHEQTSFVAKHDGIVQWRGLHVLINHLKQMIAINRNASIVVVAPDGRQLQQHLVEYGSVVHFADNQLVKSGEKIVEWDANSTLILTEKTGYIRFIDLVENVTIQSRYDEATKRSSRIVLDYKSDRYQPAISIVDAQDVELVQYYLPMGSFLVVEEGQKVEIGDILVKIARETSKTKDITGGLPRVAELFEARLPKDAAILADIDGEVVFGGISRGLRKISVVQGQESYDYFIPRGKQINFGNGDRVRSGEALTSGSPILQDILRILGPEVLQRYLVDQIQEIYRRQGVYIGDCHIELIVRQMQRKVRIVDPGDTEFLTGDLIDKIHFQRVNEALRVESKKCATAKPRVTGITMSSLETESPIAAASFQETTPILAKAAISGQIDYLFGLKENIIMGKLIPAGTGIESFRIKYLGKK